MRDRLRNSAEQAQARKHRPDYWLFILCLALLAIGVIVVYSISPALGRAHDVSSNFFVAKQGIAIGIGLVAFFVTSRVPLSLWRRLTVPLLVAAGLVTMVAVLTPIDPDYPARRWVRLGSFSFQSVELLKLALLVGVAGLLADRIREGTVDNYRRTLQVFLVVLAVVGLVVAGIQSDLGSMAVIVAMMAMMAFVAGMPMKKLALVAVAIVLLGTVAVSTTPYRRERLATFLHPASDCQVTGYQACQALISVGSGGLSGLGLGRSVQAYGYLPEAANDSIFAIYAEKFGFLGVGLLLAIFAAFFARLKSLAERAPDHFSRLIIMGILAWLATQTIINIGAMLGLLPLKGITLPLVSYGGTSVVFIMAALGLVFQASRYTSYAVQGDTGMDRTGTTPRALNRQSFDRDQSRSQSLGRRRR